MTGGGEGARSVAIARVESGSARAARDRVAREEPLQIEVGATAVAVLMRTPGHDRELALGFLVTEGVVRGSGEVASLAHASVVPDREAAGNVVRVTLGPGVHFDAEALRRNLFTSSSCGVCGKATLESALRTSPPLEDAARFAPDFFPGLPDALRAAQSVFDETGGLHAAGLFDADGKLLVVREDVGRHNAVDKAIGWAADRGRLPLAGHALMVSGRLSFEIVQKALAARIPAVAAVSAPSSLAVELAERAGMLLVGFLRGSAFNAYGHRRRLAGGPGRA
jgi:FdhD protein